MPRIRRYRVGCFALYSLLPTAAFAQPATQPAAQPAAQSIAKPADQPVHDESAWIRSVRQLTSISMGLDRAGEAYFSPDGKRVCFQAYPTGQSEYQIYVINVDGSGLTMVSKGIGATTCSYFHPSGEKLIFAANHDDLRPAPDEATERHRPRGEGTGHGDKPSPSASERPSQPSPSASEGPSRPSPSASEGQSNPPPSGGAGQGGHAGDKGTSTTQPSTARASDGRASGAQGSGGHGARGYAWKYPPGMEIYEYTFATKQLRRLTNRDGYDAECAYSPDGQSIVYSAMQDGQSEIFICDADGQNPRQITRSRGRNGGPFFSPDGRRVVYRSDRDGSGNLQIFVNNTEGTAEKALTDNKTFHWCPFWHPSGKWIIYTHADFRQAEPRKGPRFDLYLMRDDGSDHRRVTSTGDFNGLPVFSPDGRYLMWTSRRGGLESPQVFIAEFVGLTPAGELRAEGQAGGGAKP